MGWDYTKGFSKQDVVAELVRGHESAAQKTEVLEYTCKGSVLWLVAEVTDKATGEKSRWIGCSLLSSKRDFGWGSKNMSEQEGPYYYTCPLKYLEMVPVASETWRAGVREYHRRMALQPKVGDTIQLAEGCSPSELVVISVKPLLATSKGRQFRVPRKDVVAVRALDNQ